MRQKQSSQAGLQALLIDLDHCPRQIEQLPQKAHHFARIIACYGDTEPRVPLSLVTFFAAAIEQGKLEIVGMKKSGKNTADVGMAFWAGRLMAEMPPDTTFSILSEDGALEHVVHLLEKAPRRVIRLAESSASATFEAGEQQSVPAATVEPVSDAATVTLYATLHLNTRRSRPSKKTTLENSIRAFLRSHKKTASVAAIIQGLQERALISFDPQGRVIYPASPETAEPPPPSSSFQRPLFNGEGVVPF